MVQDNIVGSSSVHERLGSLVNGEAGHAFILAGPQGIGKTRTARRLAKMLLCEMPAAEHACHKCANCRYFEAGTHPDYKQLERARDEKNIRVGTVRSAIVGDVAMLPQIAKKKVYVVDADELNEEGQNALLKTLEEPAGHVIFLLTVAQITKILPTLISRCVVISLPLMDEEGLIELICQKTDIDKMQAVFFARYAAGLPGRALALAGDDIFIELRKEAVELFLSLPHNGRAWLFGHAYPFFEGAKADIASVFSILRLFVRDVILLSTVGDDARLLNEDKRDKMKRVFSHLDKPKKSLNKVDEHIQTAQRRLAANCSFESTICQMLLAVYKEIKYAEGRISTVS